MPKITPGRLHAENKGAIDWGFGMVAYGCHNYVAIVSPQSLEVVQTLDEHAACVSCVKWSKMCHASLLAEHEPFLASGDHSGTILVWNVREASLVTTLKEATGVDQIEWHPENPDTLVSIHRASQQTSGVLALWNTMQGVQIWKCPLPELQSAISLVFSPFDYTLLAFASRPGAISFVSDFNLTKPPTKVEQKYRIAGARTETKSKKAATDKADVLQMLFSPHTLNLVYVLLCRELLIFDTTLHKVIGSFALDGAREDFQSMLLCKDYPDTMFCLHVDGSMSVWARKSGVYDYDLACWNDVMQFNKKSQKKSSAISSFVNGPTQQYTIAAVGLDGTVWLWEYLDQPTVNSHSQSKGKLQVTGMISGVCWPITLLSMSPFHMGIAAVSSQNGSLQIVDIERNRIKREFTVWVQKEKVTPIFGSLWLSEQELLIYGWTALETKRDKYQNKVGIFNIVSGHLKDIRPVSQGEASCIKSVKVSYAQQFYFILFKDGTVEVCLLSSSAVIKTIKPENTVTCAEWLPNKQEMPKRVITSLTLGDIDDDSAPEFFEQFIITFIEAGNIRCYTVGRHSVGVLPMAMDLGGGLITCIATKDALVISGDNYGVLHCCNLMTAETRSFPTHSGSISQIQYSPAPHSMLLLVLFSNGGFGIWDVQHGTRHSTSIYLNHRSIHGMEIGWAGGFPTVVASDCSLRIMDKSLSTCNNRITPESFDSPFFPSLYVLPPQRALVIHTMLAHFSPQLISPEHRKFLLKFVTSATLGQLEHASGLLSRCVVTAKCFEAFHEYRLWNLLGFSMQASKLRKSWTDAQPAAGATAGEQRPTDAVKAPQDAPLNGFFELMSSPAILTQREFERADVHVKRLDRGQDEEPFKKLANFNVLLGRKEEAVDLLLSSAAANSKHLNYASVLKACVVAASVGPDAFERTVRSVALDMFARGDAAEGIQMLCIIDKTDEACRYLYSNGKWTDAAWLANLRLHGEDAAKVMRTWAYHLASTGQTTKAIELLVCLGEYHIALHLLASLQSWETAALFARCCTEEGLLVTCTSSPLIDGLLPLKELLNTTFTSYLQYLKTADLLESVTAEYQAMISQ
eukprot:TRINITY_DN18810_c0_g1_i1.p1 TRINITY_DN18810_c0_g1~~TRINITY_DN18810_c0_g1_i1.p1  ORF type:complete len:1085 (+),score=211.52 TRINITY_DN18810_c0_g1_i1:53-3307(+)